MLATDLVPGNRIYDTQIEGERLTLTTPAGITAIWHHGPCITTLTSRGYVEYSADEIVRVA